MNQGLLHRGARFVSFDRWGLKSLLARLSCLLLLAGTLGCATTATLPVFLPARFDVQGIEQLAIMEVTGPQGMTQQVRQQCVEELRKSGFYQIVDPGPPPQMADNSQQVQVMLAAAQRLGVDAIFTAELRREVDLGQEFGGVRIQFGDSKVHVEMTCRVIDARSGVVRHETTITESFSGEFDEHRPETVESVIVGLKDACIRKAIQQLVVTRQPVDVNLTATAWPWSNTLLKQGNEAARNGDWARARQAWQQAVDREPEDSRALYSLGLACEAEHDYDQARHWYEQAQRNSDTELYREALRRVELTADGYQRSNAQLARPRNAAQQVPVASKPQSAPQPGPR